MTTNVDCSLQALVDLQYIPKWLHLVVRNGRGIGIWQNKKKRKTNQFYLYVGVFSYDGDDVVTHCNRKSPLYFKCSQ